MIKLKSGKNIEFQENLDRFFQILLTEIADEAVSNVAFIKTRLDGRDSGERSDKPDDEQLLMKEIMDQCIFVTHQIFDLYLLNQDFAKFLVTGFLFNSIVLSIPNLRKIQTDDGSEKKDYIH